MAPSNHHHIPERKVLLYIFNLQMEKLMIKQSKSISQGHAANEVMELEFKPRPRGGHGGEWGHNSYSATLPEHCQTH